MIYGLVALKINSPTLVEQTTIKPCSHVDIIHMLMEMEYLYPLLPNLEAYYLLHRLQICLKVRVAPPMLGTHIIDKQFLDVWKIDNLVWKVFSLPHYLMLHLIS